MFLSVLASRIVNAPLSSKTVIIFDCSLQITSLGGFVSKKLGEKFEACSSVWLAVLESF